MLAIGIDIETVNQSGGICEFAAVGIDRDGREVFRLASLVNPGDVPWVQSVAGVHGITRRQIAEAPTFSAVWQAFIGRLGGASPRPTLVAHNASFERTQIEAALGGRSLGVEIACTLEVARSRIGDRLPNCSLPTVCAALRVELPQHHRAEPDARACAHLWWRLKQPTLELAPLATPPAAVRPSRRTPERFTNANRGRNPEIRAATQAVGSTLAGQVIVFTGAFACGLTKAQAKALAVAQGGEIADATYGSTTTIVVAGVGHPVRPEHCRSAKAREAIERRLRILSEPEFLRLVGWGG